MLVDVESGNVTLLLSLITGAEESVIEEMLMNGNMPADVAINLVSMKSIVLF